MKTYCVAEIEITDQNWVTEYLKHVTALIEKSGGRYLARTSNVEQLEGGPSSPEIMIILEWPSREAALKFYDSPEYRPYRQSRVDGTKTRLLMIPGEDIAKIANIPE